MLSWPVCWNLGFCGGLLLWPGVIKTVQNYVYSMMIRITPVKYH